MSEKNLGMLEPVELRDFWDDEAQDFTSYLVRLPEFLLNL